MYDGADEGLNGFLANRLIHVPLDLNWMSSAGPPRQKKEGKTKDCFIFLQSAEQVPSLHFYETESKSAQIKLTLRNRI